jgi:hypothetical protein
LSTKEGTSTTISLETESGVATQDGRTPEEFQYSLPPAESTVAPSAVTPRFENPEEFRYPPQQEADKTGVVNMAVAALADAEREFRTQSSELAKVIPALNEERQVILNMSKRVQRLDSVFRWHERAARAPLMKLLLMPLRRERESSNANA